MLFPCLEFSNLGMGVKHAMLTDGQSSTVAFTVLAQLCGPKANETEMGAALFTKNGEGSNFDVDFELIDGEERRERGYFKCETPITVDICFNLVGWTNDIFGRFSRVLF